MSFEPIAIVGRACLLPGADSPEALWELVSQGRSAISTVPKARWGVEPGSIACSADDPAEARLDRTWSDRGGYVADSLRRFDPTGYAVPAETFKDLDPVFLWAVDTARRTLDDARAGGLTAPKVQRTGAVFGNLSFPSAQMSRFAEALWFDTASPPARNRFCSSGPAQLVQQALGLGAGAYCLDAACASALYAIKLAIDALHDGSADMMLAGAVNKADDLFIHVGFCALKAMSASGQSRPFHADADGLVPAEGAGFVALMRLTDAEAAGATIHGVIRGVGLSNDGRGRGLLVPSAGGQARAMRQAYAQAQIDPQTVSWLECHATGTQVGDAVELQSSAEVFGERDLAVGSLKSNLGHLITAAGVAGLIKVLEAMKHEQRPPTIGLDAAQLNPALAQHRLRAVTQLEAWPRDDDAPRTAGVSAFGFGGNNAHLVVSEYRGKSGEKSSKTAGARQLSLPTTDRAPATALAVVGVGARVGSYDSAAAFQRAIVQGERPATVGPLRMGEVKVGIKGLRFPPKDLAQALTQQTAVFAAAREAVAELKFADNSRVGVLIGMETDPQVARYGARWRIEALLAGGDTTWSSAARDAIIAPLESPGVVGNMPNIPANRINSQLDLSGPGFTVSAGRASGRVALELAARALRSGELDAVVVGASDMATDFVNLAARDALAGDVASPSAGTDAAVVLVLRRADDAAALGETVYAEIEPRGLAHPDAQDAAEFVTNFGDAGAADELLQVVAGVLATHAGVQLDGHPNPTGELAVGTTRLAGAGSVFEGTAPSLHLFAAPDAEQLARALELGEEISQLADTEDPPVEWPRTVIVAANPAELELRRTKAVAALRKKAPSGRGVHTRLAPVDGELALVFNGAGSAYAGMGASLLATLPMLGQRVATRFSGFADAMRWPLDRARADSQDPDQAPDELEQLWGASALCQLHAELSLGMLGIQAQAVIGYSSGETNSLYALGIWRDLDEMVADSVASELFTRDIGGEFQSIAQQWGRAHVDWASYVVRTPLSELRPLVDAEPHVHVAIVHSEGDCVISGDAERCAALVERVGPQRCARLNYVLAVHVPELDAVREPWLELHRRPVSARADWMCPTARVYSNAHHGAYTPSTEACAQAILGQANTTLELPPTIEQAWADGVRIFVEHGPQATCGRWIKEILGARAQQALVVSLDHKGRGAEASLDAVAALLAAGVPMNWRQPAFTAPHASPAEMSLTFAAHAPDIQLPPRAPGNPAAEPTPTTSRTSAMSESMPPAPALPPVASTLEISDSFAPLPAALSAEQLPAPVPQPAAMPAAASLAASAPPQPFVPNQTAPVGPVGAVQTQLAHLAQAHTAFMQAQQQAHAQFLAFRQHADMALFQAAGMAAPQAGAVAHVPVAPVSTQAFVEQPVARSQPTLTPSQPQPAAQLPKSFTPDPPRPAVTAPVAAPMPVAPPTPVVAAAKPNKSAAAAAAAAAASPNTRNGGHKKHRQPSGPTFDRAALEVHAAGDISGIFGELFKPQDQYARQVRMPEPPLLLADRVTGIDCEPGVLGKGTIWTESDVDNHAWALHAGHLPAGVMIESGQADLMLISWMGIDLHNRGERVYRLLGCELTYHGDLPAPGETLAYQIEIDGHANQGDIRLMFFHYQCVVDGEPRLSVREGQAGFFTDKELEDSAGCLWTPEEQNIVESPRLEAAAVQCTRSSFTAEQVIAFSEGDAFACFGPGFELTQPHTRTPAISGGRMLFIDTVSDFEPQGGPWKRGYLRAESTLSPDAWFFDGHFKNDPCMPGTLMFEGCLQTMAFYMAAMGFSVERDGWRFCPVPDEPFALRCRGQATPESRDLVYEVFVEEVVSGPIPTLYADLLVTVDGRKAFHARRVGLRLIPDWPLPELSAADESLVDDDAAKVIAETPEGFRFDHRSLLACAWGKPSEAFGPIYERFDGVQKVARLPGPPYHFMSRINEVRGAIGGMEVGTHVSVDYDIPPEVWYFDQNGNRSMPYAVLLEAALQPCGWLASYVGSALTIEHELMFRNLDGTGTLHGELFDDAGTLRTEVTLTKISESAGMVIESFDVACFLGDRKVYTMDTVFGFFPVEAMRNQVGLPTKDEERALLTAESPRAIDVRTREAEIFAPGRAAVAAPMLMMVDRVTGLWPEGGAHNKGQVRGEKDVDANEWFFKAHFFQDPVQPGSLGLEALAQLLQLFMLDQGMDAGFAQPRFEALAVDVPLTWKYRGQVIPSNKVISSTLDIVEHGRDERGAYAIAEGSLWVDGKRIYEAKNLGMRVVEGGKPPPPREGKRGVRSATQTQNKSAAKPEGAVEPAAKADPDPAAGRNPDAQVSTRLSLGDNSGAWLADHCPTYTVAALPMMHMVELMASVRPGITGLRDVRVKGWLVVNDAVELRAELYGDEVYLRRDDTHIVASARIVSEQEQATIDPWPSLRAKPASSPYTRGRLFHGPAFQLQTQLVLSAEGSSATCEAASAGVPTGRFNPGLLDAATHGIPHDMLELWHPSAPADRVGYPAWIPAIDFFGATPTEGEVRVEARPDGFVGTQNFLAARVQIIAGERVWAQFRLVEATFPKGPLGSAPPLARQAFLRERRFVQGVSLSTQERDSTLLRQADVDASNWLPGTVESLYGSAALPDIAGRERAAAAHKMHPGRVFDALPLTRFEFKHEGGDGFVRTSGAAAGELDLTRVRDFWSSHFKLDKWPVEDIYYALTQRFVRRVVSQDPQRLAALRGRSCLFLANHQVGVESLLFSIIASALVKRPTITLAKAEHRESWLGKLIELCFRYPGARDPGVIAFFDREDPASLPAIMADLSHDMREGERAVMIHVQGTRATHAGQTTTKMSGALVDMALHAGVPIVPVRFVGGLPVKPVATRLEFPVDMGQQDIYFGAALEADDLRELNYAQRSERVLAAINSLGPAAKDERPLPARPSIAAAVRTWQQFTEADEVHATIACALNGREDLSPALRAALSNSDLPRDLDADQRTWYTELRARLRGTKST